MTRINVTEFKSHCLRLLEEARKTGEPIEVTKYGRPLATVLPAALKSTYRPGMFKDTVEIVGDIMVDGHELGIEWDALK